MKHELSKDDAYARWLRDLKERVRAAQLKAAVRVNSALLEFYWELGRDIVEKQQHAQWGDGFLKCLSDDLSAEFPETKGFSRRNLEYIRRWYLFWSDNGPIAQQAVAQLEEKCEKAIFLIPWSHNIDIMSKSKSRDEALFYVRKTIENNWSRAVLTHQIESGLHRRSGRAVTNFEATLPAPLSDLARVAPLGRFVEARVYCWRVGMAGLGGIALGDGASNCVARALCRAGMPNPL